MAVVAVDVPFGSMEFLMARWAVDVIPAVLILAGGVRLLNAIARNAGLIRVFSASTMQT